MANIVCFGEVLWDVFKTNKTIGGAPLNVALRLQALQNNVTIISSVGKDVDGKELLTSITKQGVNTLNIQTDNTHATSNVLVSLDDFGTATYEIKYPCAWDFIAINLSILNAVKETDAFVFGSLVARHIISYNTLLELVNIAAFNVFDVNLRPPHYTFTVIETLMQKAHFIKFNDDELYEISNYLNFKSTDLEEVVKFISKHTNTTTICVTLGKDGALLFFNNTFYRNYGYKVVVKDTVGAGDSFLAALLDQLLKKEPPQKALDFACAAGSLVASKEGATAKITTNEIKQMLL